MKKLAKKQTGGENPKLTTAKKDSASSSRLLNILDNSGLSRKNYPTLVKSAVKDMKKPAEVRKQLAKKQDGGPQQPSTKPTTSTELASKNYRPKLGPGSNMMRPDSTKKGDSSKFDPSKVSKNGWIPSRNISPKVNIQSFKDKMIKKLGGSTKKK